MIYAYRSPIDQSVRAIRKSDFDEETWRKACQAIAGLDTATWCFDTEQQFKEFAPDGVAMFDRKRGER